MESTEAVHLPPILLEIPVTRTKYKTLVTELVRIYQTYACSMTKAEQETYCRMVTDAEYVYSLAADHAIVCHPAYRQMFPPQGHGRYVPGAVTFERWAVLAALYFRPDAPQPALGLQRVAKAVGALLGGRPRPCFEAYQRHYPETSLEELLLPDTDALAAGSYSELILETASGVQDEGGAATASVTNGAEQQLKDYNTQELCEFVEGLGRMPVKQEPDYSDSEPVAASSREGSVIIVATNIVAPPPAERPKTPVTGAAASRTAKHRLSSGPDVVSRPPLKKQNRRGTATSDTPPTQRRDAEARSSPSGKLFFQKVYSFLVEMPARLDALQAQFDMHLRDAAAHADLGRLQTDRDAAAAAAEMDRQVRALRVEVRAAVETMEARAGQLVEASAARVAATEAHQKTAASTRRAQRRTDKALAALQHDVKEQDKRLQTQEQAVRERFCETASRETKADHAPAVALTRNDVVHILDELFREKLIHYLHLHAKVKEESAGKT